MPRTLCGVLLIGAVLTMAGAAQAHQTAVSNGVAVTLHVNPDDEPVAGRPTTILVTKVKPRKGMGVFSWRTCVCRLVVSDSARAVLLDVRARPSTPITFAEPGAYKIVVNGRVKRRGKWRRFSAAFAIRAGDPNSN